MTASRELLDLYFRREICKGCIQILSGADDERAPEAIQHYQDQLASIEKKIEAIEGKPPPVVVGLRTAKLFGEVNKQEK